MADTLQAHKRHKKDLKCCFSPFTTCPLALTRFSLRSPVEWVQNRATNESWGWESSQLPPVKGYRVEVSVLLKFLVLIKSLVAFILTFSITALIVRVLMSSGVVLMFPLFYCLRGLGWGDLDLHLLTLSYPWLGVPIEQLTARNKPVAPFIVAHITKVGTR